MRGKLDRLFFGVVMFGAVSSLSIPQANAQSIEEKAQVCAGCHGADGKPIDKMFPIIWGQKEGYLYIQLRDFKRGDRKSDIMQPIVASLEREDMLALAAYFSSKQWPDLGQPRPPKEVWSVPRAPTSPWAAPAVISISFRATAPCLVWRTRAGIT